MIETSRPVEFHPSTSKFPMLRLASPATLRQAIPATSRPRRTTPQARQKAYLPVRPSLDWRHGSPALEASLESNQVLAAQSSSPPVYARNLGLRRDPELGLLSLVLVISVAFGSFFSLAIVSLSALSAFKKLADSADKLTKVVSEEVPGTLASLKLSGLEINDLTSQLNNLRQRISGKQYGQKARSKRQSYGEIRGSPKTD